MNKAKRNNRTGSENQDEAPSEEFVEFERMVKKVVKVPKSEIDRRDKERRKAKGKPP